MRRIRETGCGILTILLITMPVWVITTAWRGPVYAAGALLVILSIVVALALLTYAAERRKPSGSDR
jgi:hypothetical protein